MIPGSDPTRPNPECTTCRVMGFGILTGTGLYTIYSALYASEPSVTGGLGRASPPASSPSSPTPTSSSPNGTTSRSVEAGHTGSSKGVVAGRGRPLPLPLGLNTAGFGRHPGFGRGVMAGFGALLVLAGVARGMGVTHYDVIDFKNHAFGRSKQPDLRNSNGSPNNKPHAPPPDL